MKKINYEQLKEALAKNRLYLPQWDNAQYDIMRSFGVPSALLKEAKTTYSLPVEPLASREEILKVMAAIKFKLDWRVEMGQRIVESFRLYGAPQENIERVEAVLKTERGLKMVAGIQIIELQDLEALYLKFFNLYKEL